MSANIVFWLGQAGLYFELAGKKIIIDPYLSDSVEKSNPLNYRRVPVKKELLEIEPDIIVLTHNHLDHTDPETLKYYLEKDRQVLVFASGNAWAEVRKFGRKHNYVCFNRHTRWTECTEDGCEICFTAVYAEHSDSHAIGVIIEAEGKCFYITGDTLYNTKIFKDLPDNIDVVFLPINGVGNNMNMCDAKRFAEKCGAKKVVPVHFGLFDEINPQDFAGENIVIPKIYEEIGI